jgi:hypothetical protein
VIAPSTSIGRRPHRVALYKPGAMVPDGDGGWTAGLDPLDPPLLYVRIEPAVGADAERVAAGTVLSNTSYLISGPYHPQVTTETQLTYNGRTFMVKGIANLEERNVEMVLICDEQIP